MELAQENEETPIDNSANDNETADDTLVGEAQVGEDGETVEVLLHAALDPEAGGLTWRPYPDMRGRLDSVCLLQLRCWFPPMLHDAHRHALFRRAIQGAIQEVLLQLLLEGQDGERREIRVLARAPRCSAWKPYGLEPRTWWLARAFLPWPPWRKRWCGPRGWRMKYRS